MRFCQVTRCRYGELGLWDSSRLLIQNQQPKLGSNGITPNGADGGKLSQVGCYLIRAGPIANQTFRPSSSRRPPKLQRAQNCSQHRSRSLSLSTVCLQSLHQQTGPSRPILASAAGCPSPSRSSLPGTKLSLSVMAYFSFLGQPLLP